MDNMNKIAVNQKCIKNCYGFSSDILCYYCHHNPDNIT